MPFGPGANALRLAISFELGPGANALRLTKNISFGATYFITTCLLGSIPAQGLVEIERFRISLERQPKPAGLSVEDWKARQWKQVIAKHDHCVRDEDELERIVAYVHGNPVVPGLVERAEEYRYSSASQFALREGRAR